MARTMTIPDALADRLDELAARFAERNGESLEAALAAVTTSVLARGILDVAKDLERTAPARATARKPRRAKARVA